MIKMDGETFTEGIQCMQKMLENRDFDIDVSDEYLCITFSEHDGDVGAHPIFANSKVIKKYITIEFNQDEFSLKQLTTILNMLEHIKTKKLVAGWRVSGNEMVAMADSINHNIIAIQNPAKVASHQFSMRELLTEAECVLNSHGPSLSPNEIQIIKEQIKLSTKLVIEGRHDGSQT